MLSLDCHHPDLEEFIEVKSDLNRVTKANISIRITDDFMAAVKNKTDFELSFTRKETGETIKKTVNAYELFKKICKMNWDYAEPGMLFWNRIENWNLLSNDPEFHYSGVNPCAEEPLPAGGSCLLGSINLSEFVYNKIFDFDDFRKCVRTSVKALNDVLLEGLPLHPLEEQRQSVNDWRQIGLGIFGLADALIKMEIRYGSDEAVDFCDKVGRVMAYEAIDASEELAEHIGAYPKYNRDAVFSSPFFIKHVSTLNRDRIFYNGLANSQLLTTAPTGSLSSMLGVSGGIEPIFANYYERKTESLHGHDEYYKVYTPIVKDYMDTHGITDDTQLPDYFVTAQTLDYKERIRMQAAWQKHIDASISSTINLPHDTTVEDVEELYLYAWEQGLKGVTIFRDGCKRTGILTTDTPDKSEKKEYDEQEKNNRLPRGYIIEVDNNTVGKERHLITGCGTLHHCSYFDPATGDLLENYINKGSQGGCFSNLIGLSRMISLAARLGGDVREIADQLLSVPACPSYVSRKVTKHDTSKGACCPNAIGYALLDMCNEMKEDLGVIEDEDVQESEKDISDENTVRTDLSKYKCPECGSKLVHEGGCVSCKICGWSKCG